MRFERGAKPKKKFRRYPIGYIHIDIAELRTAVRELLKEQNELTTLIVGT